ncbi:antitoxin [Rugamonas sp. FT82W]|uniref:Antitoxin n=1 Tax=Duganella vulcania TaxID=2692166 RepID=A0A845G9S9_9BURK|nr:antitoxin [Duganella vulcania]MYM89956.1 antitoxin [Duganella vulcania]
MRKECDFSKMKPVPNPFFEKLSKEVTFRLDFDSLAYFQKVGDAYGFPVEKVMQLYLQKLASSGGRLNIGFPTLEERKDIDAYIERQIEREAKA